MNHTPNLGVPDAGLHVTEACRLLDAVGAAVRLAGAPDWESPAADAYREELEETRRRMAADADALETLRSVAAGLS